MLMPFCAVTAQAAGSYFLSEGFYYGVQNGEAYVHGYEGSDWDIVIREKFLSYSVTSVEEYAFFENSTMEALSFYDALYLETLGNCAFARCTSLQYVNITPSIQSMGTGVFDGCTSLGYARFRNGALTDIPAQTFYGCSALRTVVFDNEPTSIGSFAFANCTSLEEIEIPASVTSIADTAFSGCDNLVIYCTKDSYALDYAEANDIDYVVTDAYLLGDVDGDRKTTINDVTEIQRRIAKLDVSDPEITDRNGDVNGEGLDITDATAIQRYVAELDVPYPIGEYISFE